MGRKAYSAEKREQMRASVLTAARHLFESEGRDAVTMRSVGKQLGLSAMALYGYFEGKEKLVVALLDQAFEELCASVGCRGACRGFAEFAVDNDALLCWMLEEGTSDQWARLVQTVRQREPNGLVQASQLVGLGLLMARGVLSPVEFATTLRSQAQAA